MAKMKVKQIDQKWNQTKKLKEGLPVYPCFPAAQPFSDPFARPPSQAAPPGPQGQGATDLLRSSSLHTFTSPSSTMFDRAHLRVWQVLLTQVVVL